MVAIQKQKKSVVSLSNQISTSTNYHDKSFAKEREQILFKLHKSKLNAQHRKEEGREMRKDEIITSKYLCFQL